MRRGTALANEEGCGLAVQDYEAAVKLVPDDDSLKWKTVLDLE